MNILIFGVGRSGTKAVRIYIAYFMAKYINKKLWLNYEPYYWLSDGIVNYDGVYNNVNSKQIMTENDQLSNRHKGFIKNMKHGKYPTLTKFIRGNGRIQQINEIHKADYIIGVVRPLEQVLLSLRKFNWDFFSIGTIVTFKNSRIKIWNTFINDLTSSDLLKTDKDLEILETVKSVENWELRNAFYWYVMNISLLNFKNQNQNENFILINYQNFSQDSAKVIKEIFNLKDDDIMDIKNSLFRQLNSSRDNKFPFEIKDYFWSRWIMSKLDEICYKLFDLKLIPFYKHINLFCGYKVTLLDKIIIKNEKKSIKKDVKIDKNFRGLDEKYLIFYNYMQSRVDLLMKQYS